MKTPFVLRLATVGGLLGLLLLAGCRSTYYSAMETFGYEKRDILKKRVVAARDEQQEAGQEFKDAMTRLKEISGFDGGQLEKAYNGLKADYTDCKSRADAVRKRIKDMDAVAVDLFTEWEAEIRQIQSASLQSNSREQLRTTKERFQSVQTALKSAERSMDPVLAQFQDYVLSLKHSLNAQAVASLKGEAASIQTEITKLIEQMNQSIAKADEFVKTLQ